MADYWKSQERKFCDFCKCWISNNKPSVEYHEKGKRHKENVAKRLKTITKKSVKDQKNAVKMDEALQRMEKAALQAYQHDVKNNADYTSIKINETVKEKNLELAGPSKSLPFNKNTPWYEVRAPDGKTFYWNTMTNVSIWDIPPDGYLTLEEQQIKAEHVGKQQIKAIDKHKKLEAVKQREQEKLEEEEARAAAEREKLKMYRIEPEVEPTGTYEEPIGPERKTDPYGIWKTVEVKRVKSVDLQLPKQEYIELNVPEAVPEPIQRTFKEKSVTQLDPSGDSDVSFKKRKINMSQRKNMRQRLDVD